MKPVSGRRLCQILKSRGKPGVPITVNVPVHGNRDLKPGTQRDVMKAAGLTDADL